MKKLLQLFFYIIAFVNTINSQCINTAPFGSATINSCGNGTISTCNYASEYSELTFNAVGTYTFGSSIPSDWLTLTTAANVVIAFGPQPLSATIPSSGAYRLHVSTNASCGTQNTCRITTYACGSVSTTTGCVQPNAFGSAAINSYGNAQITNCAFGGEYSDLSIGIAGLYTFASSLPTDFLTLTDASNVILFSGTTPLAANITVLGNYRLHVSTNSSCGTDNSCRITSYTCTPNAPCSGTPNAGTANASSAVVCGAQNITINLVGATMATGLTYQWQSSANNSSWADIAGQTNATTNQFVSSNTYYRCIVSCGTNSASSASQLITVGGSPIGGTTLVSASTICSGSNIDFSLSGNSSWAGLNYQWQSSTNNSSWTNLTGYTSPTLSYLPTTAIYVRCLLSCGSSSATSTSVYISAPSPIVYAALPHYETFDNTWQNGCDTRNVPTASNWSSFPVTGDRAWRRQNDGASANWNAATSGIAVAHSGGGCANFHSTEVGTNNKGDLDLHVNMSQIGKYAISFYYINPTGTDNLSVLLSENAGTSYSVKGFYGAQNIWAKKIIYYTTTSASPTSIIRFRGEGSSTTTDDLAIDSLSIKLVCNNPTINATTTSSVICAGQATTLTATGATNYTWMPTSQTGSVVVVSPMSNTNYVLTGTNDNLCFPISAVSISVSACAMNITENEYNNGINIYPNPTKEILNIELKTMNETSKQIQITNLLGEVLLHTKITGAQHLSFNISHLTSGVYFLTINNTKAVKFIKE